MGETELTDRMLEIVILIGRDQMTYAQVALALRISEHTARHYAEEIRDRIGSRRSPRKALADYYRRHHTRLDPGFAA